MSEMFKSIVEPLQTSAAVKSVFGEAVSAQGKTVIPVARVAYGFGGGGRGAREGGGGGVSATPLGVFEITDQGTRFVALNLKRKLLLAGFAGLCVGLLWSRGTRHNHS